MQSVLLNKQKENKHHFSNLSGGTCQAKFWHKRLRHLNFRDVANTTDEVSQASENCENCALGKILKSLYQKRAITKQLKNWKKFTLTIFDQ